MAERSAAELKYIDQRTRQLMVKWCDHALRNRGTVPNLHGVDASDTGLLAVCKRLEMHRVYFDHAISKKWLSAKAVDGGRKILSAGWSTAAAFLKR